VCRSFSAGTRPGDCALPRGTAAVAAWRPITHSEESLPYGYPHFRLFLSYTTASAPDTAVPCGQPDPRACPADVSSSKETTTCTADSPWNSQVQSCSSSPCRSPPKKEPRTPWASTSPLAFSDAAAASRWNCRNDRPTAGDIHSGITGMSQDYPARRFCICAFTASREIPP
jgi:hypothetical protein